MSSNEDKNIISKEDRLRLTSIYRKIINREKVQVKDSIWIKELSKKNPFVLEVLYQTKWQLETPLIPQSNINDFLKEIDIDKLENDDFGERYFIDINVFRDSWLIPLLDKSIKELLDNLNKVSKISHLDIMQQE